MYVEIGLALAKEPYKQQVNATDYRIGELREMCEAAGMDPEGDAEALAARLSDVIHHRPLDGKRVLYAEFPEDMDDAEVLNNLFKPVRGIFAQWIAGPVEWVESDDEGIARSIAKKFDCPIAKPDNVEDEFHTVHGPPGVGPVEEDSE